MFICKLCNVSCDSFSNYNSHQYLHQNWHGDVFYFSHVGCNLHLKTYNRFKQHILYRVHAISQQNDTCVFDCPVADCNYKAKNKKKNVWARLSTPHKRYSIKIPFTTNL